MFGIRMAWLVSLIGMVVVLVVARPAVADDNETPLPDSLLVIHDSVLRDARPAIESALPEVDISYIGWPGLRVETSVGLVADNRELIGDKVVIELGYNYVKRPDKVLFRQDIDALMSELANVEHVIWMTTMVYEPRMLIVNTELRMAAHRWPNLQIADWGTMVAEDTSLAHEDGYHLNRAGSVAFGAFVRDHLTDESSWNRLPEGRFRIAKTRRNFRVTGWAFDRELGKPARVRIVVDGKVAKRVTAKRERETIARRLGADHGVGFDTRLNLEPGGHTVCIDVKNFDGVRPVRLQCRAVSVG